MAVAKKAKKDGVEVKIETSNDAQKDKKHSKRKIKTATLETSGLTLSIESVEPEKTSKKAVKAKKVKGEKTPKTAELQAVPEESPVAAAEPVKPTRLRKSAKKVVAKADAIKEATKVDDDDSGEVKAWKAAFAAQTIASIQDTTAQNIQAVKKATTWKDVAKDGVEAAKDVAVVGVPTYGVVKGIKHLSKALGDRTEVSMTGDNNKYESAKTHINNDVSTYATEEGASPTVSATPAATTASPVTSHTVHEAAELPEAPEGDEIKVPEAEAPAVTEPEAAAP